MALIVEEEDIGIPPEDLPYLFDRFFHVSRGRITARSPQPGPPRRGNPGTEVAIQRPDLDGQEVAARLRRFSARPGTSCV